MSSSSNKSRAKPPATSTPSASSTASSSPTQSPSPSVAPTIAASSPALASATTATLTPASSSTATSTPASTLLRFGWWSLLLYLAAGIALETLHAFKVSWYLDPGQETRRLLFTLAHAHGTALALVTIAAALTARALSSRPLARSISASFIGATILLPLGFFLGGVIFHEGDPGLGIALVPIGALLLLYAVARTATALGNKPNA